MFFTIEPIGPAPAGDPRNLVLHLSQTGSVSSSPPSAARPTETPARTPATTPSQTAARRYSDIFAAARAGTVDDVKHFLDSGTDVNAKNASGETPLHGAAQYQSNVEVVKFLVSKGGDVNAKTNGGDTLLHLAALCRGVKIPRFSRL